MVQGRARTEGLLERGRLRECRRQTAAEAAISERSREERRLGSMLWPRP